DGAPARKAPADVRGRSPRPAAAARAPRLRAARSAASRSHAPRRLLAARRHPGASELACSCRKYSAVTLIVPARRYNPGVKPARHVRTPMQPPELVNMLDRKSVV